MKSIFTVIPGATWAFLGLVVGFLLLLVVFFLYLNKLLCFTNVGGFPCIDKPKSKKSKDKQRGKDLGSAYAYEDAETSSDSDDDVQEHFQANLKRGTSFRSAKSGQTTKSTGKPKSESKEDLLSRAEKGDTGPIEEAREVTEDARPRASSIGSNRSKRSSKPFTEQAPLLTSEQKSMIAEEQESVASQPKTEGSEAMGSQQQLLLGDQGDRPRISFFGSMSATNPEHLFDVSDLQGRDPESLLLVSKCGSLQVTFKYDAEKYNMTVTIGEAKDIPSKERGGADNVQVKLLLLPTKKQKSKTRVKQGDNPRWDEQFVFTKIPPSDLSQMAIKLRLVGNERMRRERLIGETVVPFQTLNNEVETTHWLTLEPRSNVARADSKADTSSMGSASDTGSSMQSLQHGGMPELLLGLSYNGTTGRLAVEVIKGSSFRNMAMNRAPDTYVKLTLMNPSGQEMARSKTSIRRGQPNPLYKETFMFQVALFQLPEVTLMVSVYNKRSMKRKDMIGWFSLGLNSSGEEEISHWTDMRESRGEEVCRWHVLLES